MRRPIAPLAIALALATGLVLAEFRLVVLVPLATDNPTTDAAANTATVRRFYEAVNHMLLTGESVPLDDILVADFVDHVDRPGQRGDRAGFVGYLRALHRASPALLLIGHNLVAQDDLVSALVEVEGPSRAPATGLPAVAGRPWGTIDVFRVRAGAVVEHWGDNAGFGLIEPLLAAGIPVEPPATKWIELGRLTYPPNAVEQRQASGPTLLIVESGVVTVGHDPISPVAATVIPAGASRASLSPGATVTLAAGDALALARLSRYETRNDGGAPAVVLALWSGSPHYQEPSRPASAGPVAPPVPAENGVTYEAVAGGLPATFPVNQATISVARVALAPGAALARHRVTHTELVVVESGRLVLSVEEGAVWLRTGTGDGPRQVMDGTVEAGTGLVFDQGTTVAIAPNGGAPLVALVIAIVPTIDAQGTLV